MRTCALFDAKKLRIFRNYGVSARIRGVEPVRTFFGQRGQFFAILYGRLLWTAPNCDLFKILKVAEKLIVI